MEKNAIIQSIAKRGDGQIYLGVVGAVRTGKSTFIKSRFQDMTYRQIGAEDGVSANTIKVRIQQALKLIEKRFAKYLAILTFIMIFV